MNPDAGVESLVRGLHPVAQAAALGLATFVQEDIPTISAALLAAAGKLPCLVGWAGCFLGIWIGDLLLYLVARHGGRTALEWRWVRRFVPPSAVERSERWFAVQGTWLLVTSRLVPGTRLPTYLAAGFLRLPFLRFAAVTGLAVMAWTSAWFALAHGGGAALLSATEPAPGRAWLWGALLVALVGAARWAPKLLATDHRRRIAAAVGRWRRWEFWPAWLFYFPVGLRYAQLALRHRSVTLPTAANPGIVAGGLVGESKFATLRDLMATSPEFTAPAWLLSGTSAERTESLQRLLESGQVRFPLILKPDLGQRGLGVKLIRDPESARHYLAYTPAAVVVQRYVPGPLEAGLFYYRFPDEPTGHLFALTEKVFPMLTGDGVHTVEELVWRDPRARFVAERYLARLEARRNEVLPAGAALRLVEAGNHAQGCIFRDGAHLSTPALAARVDEISRKLPGFFIGRYDVRFESEADLRAGRGFQILELNGAGAEATAIYDARNSLTTAYRTLFRQWELVFAIGAANRSRGVQPLPPRELVRHWQNARRLFASYPPAD